MLYLETERLILRDYTDSDFEAYYKLKHDDQTMYYLQDIKLDSLSDARADFSEVLEDASSPDRKYYFLHMEIKDTHEQVGSIGYTVMDDTPVGKLVHLGYFTYPKFWGNGYTSEALQKVLEFAFTQNNVYRVTTGCLAENVGSERVMQKNGLIKEAEHIDYEWHDGKMKTRLEYRLLRKEWEESVMNLGQKIIVLGCPGSGKSTFSERLHDILGLPLVHLDNVWWKSDRTHISREEFDRKLDEILQKDKWILDGDYSRTYEVRFQSCDTVFFLDYSFEECMNGIIERVGKKRRDIPWTEQELDPELVREVENYHRVNRPVVLSLIEKYSDKNTFIFRSRAEADIWRTYSAILK